MNRIFRASFEDNNGIVFNTDDATATSLVLKALCTPVKVYDLYNIASIEPSEIEYYIKTLDNTSFFDWYNGTIVNYYHQIKEQTW
jgi:hypothetical protein